MSVKTSVRQTHQISVALWIVHCAHHSLDFGELCTSVTQWLDHKIPLKVLLPPVQALS